MKTINKSLSVCFRRRLPRSLVFALLFTSFGAKAWIITIDPPFGPNIPSSSNGTVDYEYKFHGVGSLYLEACTYPEVRLDAITVEYGTVGGVPVTDHGAAEMKHRVDWLDWNDPCAMETISDSHLTQLRNGLSVPVFSPDSTDPASPYYQGYFYLSETPLLSEPPNCFQDLVTNVCEGTGYRIEVVYPASYPFCYASISCGGPCPITVFKWDGYYRLTAHIEQGVAPPCLSFPPPSGTGGGNQENVPPFVQITSPLNGAKVCWPGNVTVDATAYDVDGTIASVAFYADNSTTPFATLSSAPYSGVLTDVSQGIHVLTAKATDNSGAVTVSAPVAITAVAPSVTITSPTQGSTFNTPVNNSPTPLTITANVINPGGCGVTRVDFYQDNHLLGSDTTAPYSFTWNDVPVGPSGLYTLTAKAVYHGGNSMSTSQPITINTPDIFSTSQPIPEVNWDSTGIYVFWDQTDWVWSPRYSIPPEGSVIELWDPFYNYLIGSWPATSGCLDGEGGDTLFYSAIPYSYDQGSWIKIRYRNGTITGPFSEEIQPY